MNGKTLDERLPNYLEIRKNSKELYDTFNKVFSPALGKHIHFTSNGFNHLIYKNAKKEREKSTQILRFDLLERAKVVLERSTTYQEFEEDMEYTRVNRHGKYQSMNLVVKYWGFVAVIEKFRIKVVVRQVGNSKAEFYSVIPAWITKQYRDLKIINNSIGKGLKDENDDEVLKNATHGDDL